MPHVKYVLTCVGAIALQSGIVVSAQTVPPSPPAAQIASAVAGRARQGLESTLQGTVLDSGGKPLASAPVRLRNLKSHQVEQVSVASPSGEFRFTVQPQIPYVVEVADDAGQIIAVGDVVVVQVGEVASLLVSAPERLSALAGLFSNTAASVLSAVSAVTSTGLSALGSAFTPVPPAPPASPEQ